MVVTQVGGIRFGKEIDYFLTNTQNAFHFIS